MNDHPRDLNPTSSAHTGQGHWPDLGNCLAEGAAAADTDPCLGGALSAQPARLPVHLRHRGHGGCAAAAAGLSDTEAATLAEQFVGAQLLTGIVMTVVALALYALVYVFLRRGRNWARVLGIVLTILSTVATFVVVFDTRALGGLTVVVTVLSVVFVVVNALWLVTAFTAPVKRWFSGGSPALPGTEPGPADVGRTVDGS